MKSRPLFVLACQFGADGLGVGVRPFKGKRAALVRLYRIQTAKVVLVKIRTSAIWQALQHQPLAVGRNLGFIGDEFGLVHAKVRGDSRDLRIRNAHYAVLYPAACPAAPALEIASVHLTFPSSPAALGLGELFSRRDA